MSDSDTGGTMSFDFTTLITDRSKADVDTLSALLSKPLGQWTEEELAAYNGGAMKGGYWWTDLNRVSACMEYLDEQLRSMGYETGYIPIRLDRPEIVLPGRLPEGYTELEYIESNGNQYIDTDLKSSETYLNFSAKLVFLSATSDDTVFGTETASRKWSIVLYSYNQIFQFYVGDSPSLIPHSMQQGTVYEVNTTADNGEFIAIINGVEQSSIYSGTLDTTLSVFLFANNGAGSAKQKTKIRLYACTINNGSESRNYIPCLDPSGEIGLYDLIEHKFYDNQGSGSFQAGPAVKPEIQPNPLDPYTWYPSDSPTDGQITQYLANVDRLRSVLSLAATTPDTPAPGGKTDPAWANNIERILISVETMIKNIQKTVDLGWAMGIAHIGLYGGA